MANNDQYQWCGKFSLCPFWLEFCDPIVTSGTRLGRISPAIGRDLVGFLLCHNYGPPLDYGFRGNAHCYAAYCGIPLNFTFKLLPVWFEGAVSRWLSKVSVFFLLVYSWKVERSNPSSGFLSSISMIKSSTMNTHWNPGDFHRFYPPMLVYCWYTRSPVFFAPLVSM